MTTYLRLRCGDYPLLMPAHAVIEIAANEGEQGGGGGHRAWRDRTLRLVDLPAWLGCAGEACREQVVVGVNGDARAIVMVGRVEGIVALADTAFVDVAAVTYAMGEALDGVCPDDDGGCLLRLREPFPWMDEGVASEPRRQR